MLNKYFIRRIKGLMPHVRRQDQSVDAFSLPKELLLKAKKRAAELKMTKSGFYRYCLAKFLGYSEADARRLAEHRAVLNSIESNVLSDRFRVESDSFTLAEKTSSTGPSADEQTLDAVEAAALSPPPKYKRKR
jgi:hypothetical protein